MDSAHFRLAQLIAFARLAVEDGGHTFERLPLPADDQVRGSLMLAGKPRNHQSASDRFQSHSRLELSDLPVLGSPT